MGIARDYPSQEWPPLIYFNAVSSESPAAPSNTWLTATVPNIPPDAKAACLSCLLIITNESQEIADLRLYLKSNPSVRPVPPLTAVDYVCQTTIAGFGGQRTPCMVWVPLTDLSFQWWWYRSTHAPYPAGAAYGIKCYVAGYIR